jgi:hypothetical protein
MHRISKRLVHHCLVLFSTATIFGCTRATEPASITLSLTPTNATVEQGTSADVSATLTRTGSFTGTVSLTVLGAPPGMATNVLNSQTSGATTTTTINIAVSAATAPGTYALTVRANGSGVSEVVATFALTVTQPPAYSLTLSSSAVTIAQGASTPPVAVTIGRTNFTGPVQLAVELFGENHCGCLPAGITASFNPNPATASSSVLTIPVGSTVPTGTYNLIVIGAATGVKANAFVLLTLTWRKHCKRNVCSAVHM